MSDRTTRRFGRPSLGGSTASCWGLLGASLTWHPDAEDTGQQRGDDRFLGGSVGACDEDGVWQRVVDVAEAEREAKDPSAHPRRR